MQRIRCFGFLLCFFLLWCCFIFYYLLTVSFIGVFCNFSLSFEVTPFILLIFLIGVFCSFPLSVEVIAFICLLFFLLVCSITLFLVVSALSHFLIWVTSMISPEPSVFSSVVKKSKNENIQDYNCACDFVWVRNLVSDTKGGT
jgi:hypothetical protein